MKTKAFRAALPYTLPICVGFLFLGMSYGFLMRSQGFSFVYPMLMSLFIFAGSMEFVTANLLLMPTFQPLHAFLLTLMVNARHLFYGLSMLEKFRGMGRRKLYMIFSLTDETYSLFFVTKVPKDVKEEQFLFAIAVLDQSYWIIGSGIGALLGNVLPFSAEGIDFAMTALFVVIMVEQWMEKQNRPSVVIGLVCGLVCRLVFGADNFILPTMICVMVILLSCKRIFDKMIPEDGKEGGEPECQ